MSRVILTVLALANPAFAALAPAGEASVSKPAKVLSTVVKTGAIVEAVNHETRELKLINSEGRRFSMIVDDAVRNFDQIEPRDRIVVEYLESVAVVVAPADSEPLLPADAEQWTVAPPGDKPGVEGVETHLVTAEVLTINQADRLVTLESETGETLTVKASHKTPLDLVEIGDQVRLRVTRAVAVSVRRPDA